MDLNGVTPHQKKQKSMATKNKVVKYLTVSDLREFEKGVRLEQYTYSRGVEILNEKINERIQKTNPNQTQFAK